MRFFRRTIVPVLALLVVAVPVAGAGAHSYKLGDISIGHFRAPPPADGADGVAVYGPLLNRGGDTVTLVGARSPAADRVRFRIDRDGKKSWPEKIDLAPNKPLALAPWRVHLWLDGLHGPLAEGDRFALTLDFGAAGTTTIDVIVETAAHH